MKLTLHLILLTLFASSCAVSNQGNWSRDDKKLREYADALFEAQDFDGARISYSQLHTKDASDLLLNCKYSAALVETKFDLDKAEKLINSIYLHDAWETDEQLKLCTYYSGKIHHYRQEFNEALKDFDWYIELAENDQERSIGQREIAVTRKAQLLTQQPVDVRISNLGPEINSPNHEYVPMVTINDEILYFTSRRSSSTGGKKDPNGEFFEDILYSESIDGKWTEAKNVGTPINTDTHDATVCLSKDGMSMLIYRTNENLTGGDLYICEYIDDRWTEPALLGPEINSEYQEASACFSPLSDAIYFSSDRPGGFGGRDLYRVNRLPNGEWSKALNLGPTINTKLNEDAPAMDVDGRTLYFASQGHETMGGYDIFQSNQTETDRWSSPINVGYPINSVEDDIYFTIDAGGRTGYYNSDKIGGYGQQDIYKIDFIYRQQKQLVLKGLTLDPERLAQAATITVINAETKEVQGLYKSNSGSGKFILILHPLTKYKLFIEAPGYQPMTEDLYLDFPEGSEYEIDLSPFILTRE